MSKPIQSKALRDEMCRLVRAAAEPAQAGELVRSAIRRAALVLGFEYSRVKRYWYGEIEVPPAHEVDTAREKVRHRSKRRVTVAPVGQEEAPNRHRALVHVMLDENGRVLSAHSREFQEALGVIVPDFDMAEYAVRNFGWIEVKIEEGHLSVRLSPRVAQSRALDAVYDLLTTSPGGGVHLILRLGDDWVSETQESGGEAADRINQLVSQAHLRRSARFLAAQQPISVLFRDRKSALLDTLHRTLQLHGKETAEACSRFAEEDPAGLTSILVGRKESSGRKWPLRHLGRGIRFYSAEDRERLIGTDVRDSADRDYGEWCAQRYERAVASGDPLLEDVRAVVYRRNEPPFETSYRRLYVPLGESSGEPIVLVTCELTRHRQAA